MEEEFQKGGMERGFGGLGRIFWSYFGRGGEKEEIMKKFIIVWFVICGFTIFACAQEGKTPSAFEIIEKVGARISQIPDGQKVKNISGNLRFEIKLNETDYQQLKQASEKILGKSPKNPLQFEGMFCAAPGTMGTKIEKFLFSGKSDIGSFYIYRNFDNLVCFLPEMGIEINDQVSKIRQLMKSPDTSSIQPQGLDQLVFLMDSSNLKNLFMQGKIWFYDAQVSVVEKSGKKFVEMAKQEDGKSVKFVVDPASSTFSEIVLKDEKGTISMIFGLPEKPDKPALSDYLPKSISLNAKEKGNVINLELVSLSYNREISEDIFNLKKMSFAEFVSTIAVKLFSQ